MTSLQTGPAMENTHRLAIPAAVLLILFLGYGSQWLFYTATYLSPGPLSTTETVVFNILLSCLWWTYYKACRVDPGRFHFPDSRDSKDSKDGKDDKHNRPVSSSSSFSSSSSSSAPPPLSTRWCRKCNAPKPRRAHHCRHCARCVPKMDHHCPWTGNCVSMQTFPYFLRFVVYTNASLWMLAVLLGRRFYALWRERHLPAYLGPSLAQIGWLTVLSLVCGGTMLALGVMLSTTVHGWLFNTTMIESWEVDRHEAVVERYRHTAANGTYDSGEEEDSDEEEEDSDDDENVAAAGRVHVEFPYDLGLFENMAQAMGTANVLAWFFPLAGGPTVGPYAGGHGPGWDWPENGFNDKLGMWPPPDPDKLRQAERDAWVHRKAEQDAYNATLLEETASSPAEQKAAFEARQAADLRRRRQQQQQQQQQPTGPQPTEQTRWRVQEIFSDSEKSDDDGPEEPDRPGRPGKSGRSGRLDTGMDGKPGWTNADGDRLCDYGVDEEADEDVPLGVLLRRKKGQ